jgi:hypothetical protein
LRNPCHVCERALLDKNECSLDCDRRLEYCRHLGIIVQQESCSSVRSEHPPYKRKVAGSSPARTTKNPTTYCNCESTTITKLPKPPRPSKPPRTCPNHPDRPRLKYYRECLECVSKRREERRQTQAKPPKPPKLPCLNHPDWPAYDRRNRLCRNCVKERNLKKAKVREENWQARELAKSLKPKFDWHGPRPMRSKDGRLEQATTLMKEGKANREIYRLTGMSITTGAKLRRILEEQNGGPFLCPCGKPATHQTWCSYRFSNSLKRQKFISEWSKKPD